MTVGSYNIDPDFDKVKSVKMNSLIERLKKQLETERDEKIRKLINRVINSLK